MKAWRALLVAEFRRAAGFLPWLVGLHGLTLGARTRWAWDVSPDSLALLEWASWTVAGLVVGISLWQDAPLRRDRFLATRPYRLATLVTAKALALWGIAVLPFVAVEFAALRWNGMAGEIVGLGTLQLVAWLTALLAAAFPLLWWWSSRRMAVAGLLTGVLTLVLATLVLSRLPGNRNIYSGTPWTVPVNPLSMLETAGLFALGGCLLLPLLRGRVGVVRGLAFSALVGLSLWGGLVISFRQAPADEIMPASLVDLTVQCEKYQSGDYDILSLTVPSYQVPVDIERTWTLAKLVVNGRNITHWPSNEERSPFESGNYLWAVQERVGKPLETTSSAGSEQPAREVLHGRHTPARRMSLEVSVLETRHAWQVVADLPAKEGATARSDDTQWRISNLPQGGVGESRLDFVVDSCQGRVWFGRSSERREGAYGGEILLLVDRTSGKVFNCYPTADFWGAPMDSLQPPATALLHQRRQYSLWITPVNWSHEIRLMVVRPKVVRRILHPWRPQNEVNPPILPPPSEYQPLPTNPGPSLPVGEWLAAHPVPGVGASTAAAEAWWDELGDYLARGRNYRAHTDVDLKRAAATMVAAHPAETLEAYDRARRRNRYDRELLEYAIGDYLTAEKLARLPNWQTDPLIVELAVSKGWVPVIAAAVTRKARTGGVTDVSAVLTGAPEQFGLSEAEWLDYFRLRPSGATYQALVDKVVPQSVLDREVERILGPLRTRTTGHDWPPLLDLALGSGRREGPQWLREELSSARWHVPGQTDLLMAYFVIPELPAVRGQSREEQFREWFLAQDVSRFVYDPKIRKYHLF